MLYNLYNATYVYEQLQVLHKLNWNHIEDT